MKILKKIKNKYTTLGMAAGAMMMSSSAVAEVKNLGELSTQGGNTADSVVGGILGMVGLVGFVFFLINGTKLLNERNNQQETSGQHWKGLLLGIFLMSPFTIQALFFNSALDESKSADDIRSVISVQNNG